MQNATTKAARLLAKQTQFRKCQTHSAELDILAKNISEHLSLEKETVFVLIKLISNTSSAKALALLYMSVFVSFCDIRTCISNRVKDGSVAL
jgi:hypothetical protein